MRRWLATSFSVHLAVGTLLFLIKPNTKIPEIKFKTLTEQEFKEVLKKAQIDQVVSTSPLDTTKQPMNLQKVYLSDKNQKAAKNTQAPNSGKFKNSGGQDKPKTTSITQKGKFNPEKKGKGISSSDDFIEGAEIGPMTILNSQEFKYFSYYDRIKQIVAENWRTLIRKAIQQVKANPKKYGNLEVGLLTTKLEIILNAKGEILEIRLVGNSGQETFDLAAKTSFEHSAPFAEPPKELVKDGKFSLRWDFYVQVEDAGLIKAGGGQVNH